MASKLIWFGYAVDHVLRSKLHLYKKIKRYSKNISLTPDEASSQLIKLIQSGKPFAAGRLGLFELAAMRMYEFNKEDKYQLVMDNIYNCAGFFPNDISLGHRFTDIQKNALAEMDLLACSENLCENYFINKYMQKGMATTPSFDVFDVCLVDKSWSSALKGKKVLVVLPFEDSVKQQYARREELFKGSDILPEFTLLTYKPLMTVGDLKDSRFDTWFDALEFMENEICALDFDIALLGCGAYGFPLASAIKKHGKSAIHVGGALQILFGIMGKRWDGTRTGDTIHIREDIAKYYNEYWTYPIEEKPTEAGKVEYGPYWK